jgi:hypothetical protein
MAPLHLIRRYRLLRAVGLRAISIKCAGTVIDASHEAVILRESGVSSTPQLFGSITNGLEYWIARFRGR